MADVVKLTPQTAARVAAESATLDAGALLKSAKGAILPCEHNACVLMGEAGAALDLGPPGISGLVDRMAAADLIKRRADPDDGRAWRLWLTPAGRTALAQAKAGLVEVNARLTEGFSEAEIDVVARWLTSLQTRFPRGEDQ